MPLPSYAYAAAHIFAVEKKLLSRERVERMVEAPTAGAALGVLAETEYATGISDLSGPHDYEKLLSGEIKRIYDFFRTISPNPQITNLFFSKYDFHNIKVLLKSQYLGEKHEELLVEEGGNIGLDTLKAALKNEDYRLLPDYMGDAIEEVRKAMSQKVDPQRMSLILDRAMYDNIFRVCRDKRDNFVLNYFVLQAGLINIRTFLRVKKIGESFEFLKSLLLPNEKFGDEFFRELMDQPLENILSVLGPKEYSGIQLGLENFIETGSLTTFERLMDDFLLNYVRAARWNPQGIEPIIGYLLAKENEIKLIRIIMVGKINKLPVLNIRERLRDVYV